MGANPYCYLTTYQSDIGSALAALREQEFRAGRYDPALQAADPPTYTLQQRFPPSDSFPSPGAQHGSLEEAFADGMESGSGTGSILDIMGLADFPQLLHASPTTHETLMATFASSTPSHDMALQLVSQDFSVQDQLMKVMAFWDEIGRGEARYFIIYDQGTPSEIFFAGMSID